MRREQGEMEQKEVQDCFSDAPRLTTRILRGETPNHSLCLKVNKSGQMILDAVYKEYCYNKNPSRYRTSEKFQERVVYLIHQSGV
jgi:hypothetical protein